MLQNERDGFRCIWAQTLDAEKRPQGPAIAVFHAHEARRSLAAVGIRDLSLALAQDRIVFNMSERTGNLWMLTWRSGGEGRSGLLGDEQVLGDLDWRGLSGERVAPGRGEALAKAFDHSVAQTMYQKQAQYGEKVIPLRVLEKSAEVFSLESLDQERAAPVVISTRRIAWKPNPPFSISPFSSRAWTV